MNILSALAAALQQSLEEAVAETAEECQQNIQNHIRANGQVRTENMLKSIYYKTASESTYTDGEKRFAEIDAPENDMEAYVAVGAEYAAYQEFGTRYMPGRPFFFPGIEDTKRSFEDKIQTIEERLKGKIP